MDCLRRRVPAAVFGTYDSKEYKDLVYAQEEEQQYAQERAYQQRKARFDEQNRREQERLAQNQVLTMPDGSVTSRITWTPSVSCCSGPAGRENPAPSSWCPASPSRGRDIPSVGWPAFPAVGRS